MNKPGEDHDLKLLKEYVKFLLNSKLSEASVKFLKLLQTEELPLLKFFSHLSEEALLHKVTISLQEFLNDILSGLFLEKTLNKIAAWKENRLPEIARNEVEVFDILLVNSLRKQLLLDFLPEYTTQNVVTLQIVKALEKTFLHTETQMLKAYVDINQEELYNQNQFLSQLIQNSIMGVWAINKEMKILEWNPILEHKFKIKREDALGKNIFELFPDYKDSKEGKDLQKVFKGRKITLFDRKFKSVEGWYDAFIIPIRDKDNKISSILNILHDITSRKKVELNLQEHKEELQTANEELREQREELQVANEELNENFNQLIEVQNTLKENERRLLEAQSIAHLGSWEYDIATGKICWSEEMKKIFGYDGKEPLDYETYLKMIHPEDKERIKEIVAHTLQTHSPYSFEHKIERKDGSERYILANGYAVLSTENTLLKLRGTGLDITELKLAEIKNKENQLFISKIAETTPDVITVFDLKQQKNIYANREIYQVLGYSKEEVEKIRSKGIEGLKALFHPDDFTRIANTLKNFETYKGNKTKEIEYRIKNKGGHWLWILGRYNVFKKDKNNLPVQIIGVSRDITSRKLAEQKIKESEKRLRDSQTMAKMGYWELDVQTEAVYWSDELYNIFQIPLREPMNFKKVYNLVYPEDRKRMREKVKEAVEKGESYVNHYRIIRPDGEERSLITKGEPFKDEEGVVNIVKGIIQDITERKVVERKLQQAYEELKKTHLELQQSEESLKELNSELEKRVDQRTRKLLESNERLQKKNADLDNFIYTASHDLKVPIANIEGLLNLLKNKVKDKLKENDQILLNMMDESVERFNTTIKDLTQISKIQKDLEEETTEKISFSDVLNDLMTDMADLIAQKKAQIKTNLKVEKFHFVKKNLRSILFNLIMNALRYSAPGRTPTILITTDLVKNPPVATTPESFYEETKNINTFIVLTIQDNGLGIPENQLQKIFSLFKRYHTNIEGSGIGLYIVKRIIENNGGKIAVESEVGVGTSFKLFFPYFT